MIKSHLFVSCVVFDKVEETKVSQYLHTKQLYIVQLYRVFFFLKLWSSNTINTQIERNNTVESQSTIMWNCETE